MPFDRPAAGSSSDPANQDRITDNVWLTRDMTQGIFNIKQEASYDKDTNTFHAPADTRWATNLNNTGKTIAASNYQDLSFTYWRDAYGGTVGSTIINRDAVVHLVTDDIYLDLKFTDWGAAGGGFAYIRAVAPTTPTPTGDYNGNLFVDAADYVIWRDSIGQPATPPGSGADGNANGEIDPGDYDYWAARFGNAVPSGAVVASLAVPEPAGAALILCATSFVSCCRCRRPKLTR